METMDVDPSVGEIGSSETQSGDHPISLMFDGSLVCVVTLGERESFYFERSFCTMMILYVSLFISVV